MKDPTGDPSDNGSSLHRPLDASRLRDIVTSELREHRDVHHVDLRRSIFADRHALDVADHYGRSWRISFLTEAHTPVWSRP